MHTTPRYGRRPGIAKRKAVGLLDVPYRKQGLAVEETAEEVSWQKPG